MIEIILKTYAKCYIFQMLKNKLTGRPTDNCPICHSLEEKITDQILSSLKAKKFSRRSIICDQGGASQGLYLISKGSVRVSRITPNGKEMILDILHPGSIFGEAGILGEDKSANQISSNEDAEVFYISHEAFQGILIENPEIYKNIFSSLVKWMDKLNSIIESINNPSAKDRVTTFLKKLSVEQNHALIHLNGKKHEVALMLGLRPETFSRVLSDLENSEIIKMNHKQIQILKLDSL